jgi:hypothetical protein
MDSTHSVESTWNPCGFHGFHGDPLGAWTWILWIPCGVHGFLEESPVILMEPTGVLLESMDSIWIPHGFHMDWYMRKIDDFTWILQGLVCDFSPQFISVEIQPQIHVKEMVWPLQLQLFGNTWMLSNIFWFSVVLFCTNMYLHYRLAYLKQCSVPLIY